MGASSDEAPRQSAQQFAASDQVAKVQGGTRQTTPTTSCKVWKLKVNVTATVGPRKPKLGATEVHIDWSDKTLSSDACAATADHKASTETMLGHGAYSADCRASCKGWYLEAPKSVSLVDGDDKSVDLVLKPAVYIAFEVREHKTGDLIEDVKVTGNFSKLGDVGGKTPKDTALEIEHDDLRPGDTCKLQDVSHDTVVWEVVGSVTSA